MGQGIDGVGERMVLDKKACMSNFELYSAGYTDILNNLKETHFCLFLPSKMYKLRSISGE